DPACRGSRGSAVRWDCADRAGYCTRAVEPTLITIVCAVDSLPSGATRTTVYSPVGTRRMVNLPSFSIFSSRRKPLSGPCTTMVSPATASPEMFPELDWARAAPAKARQRAAAATSVFKDRMRIAGGVPLGMETWLYRQGMCAASAGTHAPGSGGALQPQLRPA